MALPDSWAQTPVTVFDTETTGKDPTTARVVAYAAGWLRYPELSLAVAEYVNPGEPIPDETSQVHGIYDDMVATAARFEEHLPRLNKYFGAGDCVLGYGVEYDITVLRTELTRLPAGTACRGFAQQLAQIPQLDPLPWIRWYFRDLPKRNLSAVCTELQLEIGRAHSADGDVLGVARLAQFLIAAGYWTTPTQTLAKQAQLQLALSRERQLYETWLYEDRRILPKIRYLWGKGRYIGQPLAAAPADYVKSLLTLTPPLPPAVVQILRSAFNMPDSVVLE